MDMLLLSVTNKGQFLVVSKGIEMLILGLNGLHSSKHEMLVKLKGFLGHHSQI